VNQKISNLSKNRLEHLFSNYEKGLEEKISRCGVFIKMCSADEIRKKSPAIFLHAIDLTSTSKMSGGYTGAFFRYDFGKGLKSN